MRLRRRQPDAGLEEIREIAEAAAHNVTALHKRLKVIEDRDLEGDVDDVRRRIGRLEEIARTRFGVEL
jgi:hypothetical protein